MFVAPVAQNWARCAQQLSRYSDDFEILEILGSGLDFCVTYVEEISDASSGFIRKNQDLTPMPGG